MYVNFLLKKKKEEARKKIVKKGSSFYFFLRATEFHFNFNREITLSIYTFDPLIII